MAKPINYLKFAPLALLLTLMASCSDDALYSEYHRVPSGLWDKDSVYRFDVTIADTTAMYQIDIMVRNAEDYGYQNLWLFLDGELANNNRDTLNIYLADDYGRWRGAGAGSLYDESYLYRDSVRFERSGVHSLQIGQGMRYDLLPGISDIGLRVVKK